MKPIDIAVTIIISFMCGFTLCLVLFSNFVEHWLVREGVGEFYLDKNQKRQFRLKKQS